MRHVLFYISGHGYGHATRSAEVMRELAAADPTVAIHVRTAVPEHIFDAAGPAIRHTRLQIDSGAVERFCGLEVDPRGTLERAAMICQAAAQLIAQEIAYVRREQISLIVSDIPPLAGEIAAAAGVEAAGISNFVWSWMCEPYIHDCPEFAGVLDSMREGYRKMRRFVRLPFSQSDGLDMFEQVIDAPIVTRRTSRDPREVRAQLGLTRETRPIVFPAMRGALAAEAIDRAASANEIVILYLDVEGRVHSKDARLVRLGSDLRHADVMAAADVIVSKAGYGIVSECVAGGKSLLYPRRKNFREDEILLPQAARYLRLHEISRENFLSGNWSGSLRELLAQPAPAETARVDGAKFCARLLMPDALQTFTL